MSALEITGLVWLISAALQFLAGALLLLTEQSKPDQHKIGARAIILVPFAPLLTLVSICRGLAKLYHTADFKNKQGRK